MANCSQVTFATSTRGQASVDSANGRSTHAIGEGSSIRVSPVGGKASLDASRGRSGCDSAGGWATLLPYTVKASVALSGGRSTLLKPNTGLTIRANTGYTTITTDERGQTTVQCDFFQGFPPNARISSPDDYRADSETTYRAT